MRLRTWITNTPLREGGSLAAIVEFRGAAGPKALIAEFIAGELARALGLPVPKVLVVELDEDGQRRAQPGLDCLPGSITFDPSGRCTVGREVQCDWEMCGISVPPSGSS